MFQMHECTQVIHSIVVVLLPNAESPITLGEPGFELCAAVLKPWACFFSLHCSSSLSCIHRL